MHWQNPSPFRERDHRRSLWPLEEPAREPMTLLDAIVVALLILMSGSIMIYGGMRLAYFIGEIVR